MAEEVKTHGTSEGTEPQTDNTGAQEPEKKYTEEEIIYTPKVKRFWGVYQYKNF